MTTDAERERTMQMLTRCMIRQPQLDAVGEDGQYLCELDLHWYIAEGMKPMDAKDVTHVLWDARIENIPVITVKETGTFTVKEETR